MSRHPPRRALVLVVAGALLAGAVLGGSADAAGAAPSAAVRPVPGHVVRGFDPPAHPYGPGHRGVDLAADPGDRVRSALAGRIAFAGAVAHVGWVTVDHGGGLVTTYGDLAVDGPDPPRTGDRVRVGQVIGVLADRATHLDWGARLDGAYLDPTSLLLRWRLHLTSPAA
jgi:murein DD-endopeptidase MepM/ murein hydrolase activator NlpD